MPRTMDSPANIMNAVDYFKAKLQFENTPHGVKAIMGLPTVLLVDVRDRESYESEHIKGAVNIPLEDLPKRLRELPKDKTIVCYCWRAACAMAPKACLELAHRDYKVQEMTGGIAAWKEAGFEVERAETFGTDRAVERY